MRILAICLLVLMLCGAMPVDAAGKPPQEYKILSSTMGDFPPITWLEYWNAAFVGYAGTYTDAFTIARDAAARGGWETANIVPESPAPQFTAPVYVVLIIHTAPPGGPQLPIIGLIDQ